MLYIKNVIFSIIAFPVFLFLFKKRKNILIFGFGNSLYENNIRFLYEYYIKNFSDKYSIYAVFEKDSVHGKKYIDKERLLNRGYARTYLLTVIAKGLIFDTSNSDIAPGIQKYLFWVKKYFITHGYESIKNIDYILDKKSITANYFFMSSTFDRDIRNKFDKFPNTIITGFPRYDYYNSSGEKKYVVVMLTWRNYFTNDAELKGSEYFLRIKQILSDERLRAVLEKYDCYCYIKLHDQIVRLLNQTLEGDGRIIIDQSHDFSGIVADSFLLITDYSSIA
ncbi:MAG: CDP-glycerol glycerophosphotransferase family protein, partial [Bacteroidales bacterium]|nr:CDP-glycerol glycerophosphotransferase family protein [Bacteroidales bacterium]